MKMTFPTTNHSQFSNTARAVRFSGNDTQPAQQPKGKNKMTLEQMLALEDQCDEIHLSEAKLANPTKGKNKMSLEQMLALEDQCDEIHLSEAERAHRKQT